MAGKKSNSSAHRDPCAFVGCIAGLLSDLASCLIGGSDSQFIADDPVVTAGFLAVLVGLELEADTGGGHCIIVLPFMFVAVLAFNHDSLGALSYPNLGALACLESDVAALALRSGSGGSEASELLVSAVILSLGADSDEGNKEKVLKHMLLSKIF